MDQRKEQEKITAEQRVLRLQDLKELRKARVPEEPLLSDDHVTITIRHPYEGSKTRLFFATSNMVAVYDWAGSFTFEPEFYEIVSYNGKVVSPDQRVESSVFNMRECDSPLNMTSTGTVAFAGYAVNENNPVNELDEIMDDESMDSEYVSLQTLRMSVVQSAQDHTQTLIVNREAIYVDMVSYFSHSNFNELQKVDIRFENEDAVGDGVSRDALTLFFDKTYRKFEGSFEKVPMPTLETKELEAVGKIITASFIFYNVYPFRIAHASLKHALYNDVTNDELFQSFMNYVTPKEASLIRAFANGRTVNSQVFIDIFSEARVYDQPTRENIYQLCIKAARISLIKFPSYSMNEIVTGMGTFWHNVTAKMMGSIRAMTNATPARIMNALNIVENTQADQKVTTWLHRFIRSAEKDTLHQLIRFITGSSNLIPDDIIKVEYIDQHKEYVRPIAETCFKILRLPRQYESFSHLYENILYYLSNEDLWVVSDAPIIGLDL